MLLQLKILFPILFEVHRVACKCMNYSDMTKVPSVVTKTFSADCKSVWHKCNWQLSYTSLPVSCQRVSDCRVRAQDTLE